MTMHQALDYVTGAAEHGEPRDVSGAIGGLVVALIHDGEESEVPELLEIRNRLRTDESRHDHDVEEAYDSLRRIVEEIEERTELVVH
jgi:hypothetical protein